MSRIACIVFFALLVAPCISDAETIDVQIKGVDDGAKTTKQRDYKEAVLFAKREAIERAGVKIKSMTTVKDLVVNSDYIESKAEAVLLPGYNILDMGYSVDGTYQIVLVGKVKTVSEGIDSKELRYAKSLVERGEKSKARRIMTDILNNSKDDNVVAEAMYCSVLWQFASDEIDTLQKLKAYYPNSKYVSRLKAVLEEREKQEERRRLEAERKKKQEERKRLEAERKKKQEERRRLEAERKKKQEERRRFKAKYEPIVGGSIRTDGHFIAGDKKVVLDTKTGFMWAEKTIGHSFSVVTWHEAKASCENYRGGGYTDWRMPTLHELATLYDKNKRQRHYAHVIHVTRLIDMGDNIIWSSKVAGGQGHYFNFIKKRSDYMHLTGSGCGVALPVRGGK